MPRKNTNARPSRTPRPLQLVPDTTQAPVRTEATDKIWAALHAHPGSTAAELAAIAGVGRSTATKALAAWDSEGIAERTACIAANGRRGADRWRITPPTPDEPALAPAEAITLGTDGEPVETALTDEEAGEPAEPTTEPSTPDEAAPDHPASATAEGAGIPATSSPRALEEAAASMSAEQGHAVPHSDRTRRLGQGALRGMVEDYLTDNAGQDFGPTALGKQLGRSPGAIANALEKLVAGGYAVRTSDSPKRYATTQPGTATTE